MRDDAERIQPATIGEWRAWLAENHARGSGVRLVTYKRSADGPTLGYEECVEQVLCFGWVDSTAKRLDDERRMIWYAPRRRGSGWARTTKARIERLTAAGLMTPAGQAVVDAAKADGSWTLLDGVEDLVVPQDLADALAANPPARERFDAFPPSVRRAILLWIVTAKRPATRAARITTTAEKAAHGLTPQSGIPGNPSGRCRTGRGAFVDRAREGHPAAPRTAPEVPVTTTVSAPTVRTAPSFGSLLLTGAAATAGGAAAAVLVAAAGQTLGISTAVGGAEIPLSGFAVLTVICCVIGLVIAAALRRFARSPRTAWIRTTGALTVLSFVPDLIVAAAASTRLLLMLTHVAAAAIVVPSVARRLP
ncbi:DUF6069 family protein [Pseudonocardia thermophila]|uniref:DUF6069 family protein n=1 Tax=Pseudonocardia thermophila TaxID=1848 RepID=UPI00248DF8C1|nr:DUF6069 family protein [Pseudonocardia thermophila]